MMCTLVQSPLSEKQPNSGSLNTTSVLHHHNSLVAPSNGGSGNCCMSPSSSISVISNNRGLSSGGLKIPPLKSPTTFRKQATIDENPSPTLSTVSLSASQLRLDLQHGNPPTIQNGSASLPRSPTGSIRCNGISESTHQHISNGEVRLQQSLSTPCPTSAPAPVVHRKESEYRRFKSEGSTGGPCSLPASEMDVAIDDLSPIADPNTSPHRLNIFQDGVTGGPLTKHSHTEQVMMMHTLKTKLQKYQTFIDKAFQNIQHGDNEQIIEGCTIVAKVMTKAWMFPKISHDLSYALCDYIRDQGYFDMLIKQFINSTPVRL